MRIHLLGLPIVEVLLCRWALLLGLIVVRWLRWPVPAWMRSVVDIFQTVQCHVGVHLCRADVLVNETAIDLLLVDLHRGGGEHDLHGTFSVVVTC